MGVKTSSWGKFIYLSTHFRGRCELFMPKTMARSHHHSPRRPGRSGAADGDPIERYRICVSSNQTMTTSRGLVWSPTPPPEAGPSLPQACGHLAGGWSPGRDVAALTDNSTGASHCGGARPRPSHRCSKATSAATSYWALQLGGHVGDIVAVS